MIQVGDHVELLEHPSVGHGVVIAVSPMRLGLYRCTVEYVADGLALERECLPCWRVHFLFPRIRGAARGRPLHWRRWHEPTPFGSLWIAGLSSHLEHNLFGRPPQGWSAMIERALAAAEASP